ncbi:hypothetical protein OIU74_001865 [Salix koriyanagi]|uniref:Tetratricopeptide repeat-like superfamily protein n=1 Tax=Salix koriyanagi TaxID=2511006 RepID=A0A9Q0X306_9ROSI|nr:hypothetical protein OIU74_001865 [Salix koriyanagi]
MAPALSLRPCISASSSNWSQPKMHANPFNANIKIHRRLEVVAMGMLSPRKFLQKRRKVEVFKDASDEADQKNWRRLMKQIEDTGSAVSVLRRERIKKDGLPRDLVLGTLVRFKQLKKWDLVSEILEWLQSQQWWDFNEMDFLMLITAYGKLGDFNGAEMVLRSMNRNGYVPNVVSHTALMEAYGRGGRYNNAEAIFRRMQTSGPEPSALTYQIVLKTFVEGNKFKEAEEVFESLLNREKSPLEPDQKMFHMMIYMQKKAGNYEKARKLCALMAERGMQRSGLRPDVVSYASLIKAYGRARREEEALAVFEEMLDAGVRPSHKAYNILLDAFAISGMVEQARVVFKSMRRDRCTPDLCSYTTMLSAYVNASDMEGAENFIKRLRQDGLKPNVVTYGVLIKGHAKVNNLEKMMEIYEEMQLNGIKANQTILTTIMDAYGKNKDFGSAVVWYKEMEHHGVPPDQKAQNILLSLAKTEDELKEANQLVGHPDDCGIQSINGASRFADEDGSDDETDDEDNYEEANKNDDEDDLDDAAKTVSYSKEREDLIFLDGDNQHNLEALHALTVMDL